MSTMQRHVEDIQRYIRQNWPAEPDGVVPAMAIVLGQHKDEAAFIPLPPGSIAQQRELLRNLLVSMQDMKRPASGVVVVNEVWLAATTTDAELALAESLKATGRLEDLPPALRREMIQVITETPARVASVIGAYITRDAAGNRFLGDFQPMTFLPPYPGFRRYFPDSEEAVVEN